MLFSTFNIFTILKNDMVPGHFFPDLGFGLMDRSQQHPWGLFSWSSHSPRNDALAAFIRSRKKEEVNKESRNGKKNHYDNKPLSSCERRGTNS